jgi:hypothetical protein
MSSSASFTLKNIDVEKIGKKYNLVKETSDIKELVATNKTSTKTTKITDLANVNFSFLDESKRSHTCNVSMIDINTQLDIKEYSNYCCFWDRHKITENTPIGCPIKYVSPFVEKTYNSKINKETYVIREYITTEKLGELVEDFKTVSPVESKKTAIPKKKSDPRKKYKKRTVDDSDEENKSDEEESNVLGHNIEPTPSVKVSDESYYVTDGIFCSFNCCMAFINENKHNKLYANSKMLLLQLYNTLNETNRELINSAPHWRTLKSYGGFITIEKFRQGFTKYVYEDHGSVVETPGFNAMRTLYEESIRI